MTIRDRETASVYGKVGAAVRHSRHDPAPQLARAREALEASWLTKARQQAAERNEDVSEEELQRRAFYLRQEHFARLSMAAVQAKRKAAEAREKRRTSRRSKQSNAAEPHPSSTASSEEAGSSGPHHPVRRSDGDAAPSDL